MSITAPRYLEGGARVLCGISSVLGVEDLLKAPSRAFEAAELASTLPGGRRGLQAFCTALQEASLESREGNQV